MAIAVDKFGGLINAIEPSKIPDNSFTELVNLRPTITGLEKIKGYKKFAKNRLNGDENINAIIQFRPFANINELLVFGKNNIYSYNWETKELELKFKLSDYGINPLSPDVKIEQLQNKIFVADKSNYPFYLECKGYQLRKIKVRAEGTSQVKIKVIDYLDNVIVKEINWNSFNSNPVEPEPFAEDYPWLVFKKNSSLLFVNIETEEIIERPIPLHINGQDIFKCVLLENSIVVLQLKNAGTDSKGLNKFRVCYKRFNIKGEILNEFEREGGFTNFPQNITHYYSYGLIIPTDENFSNYYDEQIQGNFYAIIYKQTFTINKQSGETLYDADNHYHISIPLSIAVYNDKVVLLFGAFQHYFYWNYTYKKYWDSYISQYYYSTTIWYKVGLMRYIHYIVIDKLQSTNNFSLIEKKYPYGENGKSYWWGYLFNSPKVKGKEISQWTFNFRFYLFKKNSNNEFCIDISLYGNIHSHIYGIDKDFRRWILINETVVFFNIYKGYPHIETYNINIYNTYTGQTFMFPLFYSSFLPELYYLYKDPTITPPLELYFLNSPLPILCTKQTGGSISGTYQFAQSYKYGYGETPLSSWSEPITLDNNSVKLYFGLPLSSYAYTLEKRIIYYRDVNNPDDIKVLDIITDNQTYEETYTQLQEQVYTPNIKQLLPSCKYTAKHLDRLLWIGDVENPNVIYFSEVYYPEVYLPEGFRVVYHNDGDEITSLYSMYDRLYIFKKYYIYVCIGDIANGSIVKLSEQVGNIAPKSLAGIEDMLFFLSYNGICLLQKDSLNMLSYQVLDLSQYTEDEKINAFGDIDLENYEYRLYIGQDIYAYNIITQSFYKQEKSNFKYQASAQVEIDDKLRNIFAYDNQLFLDNEGLFFDKYKRFCYLRTKRYTTRDLQTNIIPKDLIIQANLNNFMIVYVNDYARMIEPQYNDLIYRMRLKNFYKKFYQLYLFENGIYDFKLLNFIIKE